MTTTRADQPGLPTFLDSLIEQLGLKNDAALSRELGVAPPVISKMRHGRLPLGPSMILYLHETYGMVVSDIRSRLAGEAC